MTTLQGANICLTRKSLLLLHSYSCGPANKCYFTLASRVGVALYMRSLLIGWHYHAKNRCYVLASTNAHFVQSDVIITLYCSLLRFLIDGLGCRASFINVTKTYFEFFGTLLCNAVVVPKLSYRDYPLVLLLVGRRRVLSGDGLQWTRITLKKVITKIYLSLVHIYIF